MSRVLIVDDEHAIAEALAEVLTQEGYAVMVAHTLPEALAHLAEARPDVALVDLMMPQDAGRRLVAHLHEQPELDSVPVVLTSAGAVSLAERRSAARFLAKPFELDALLRTLGEVLRPPGRGP